MAEGRALGHRDPTESLARAMRGAIGNLRAAAEALVRFPEAPADRRDRLLEVLSQESERLSRQIEELDALSRSEAPLKGSQGPATLAEFLDALALVATAAGARCEVEALARSDDGGLRIAVDFEPLVRATGELVAQLRAEFAVTRCRLQLRGVAPHLLVDLAWDAEAKDLARLSAWQTEALAPAEARGADARPGLRDAARDLDGEAWFNLDRDGATAHVRVLIPGAKALMSSGG